MREYSLLLLRDVRQQIRDLTLRKHATGLSPPEEIIYLSLEDEIIA